MSDSSPHEPAGAAPQQRASRVLPHPDLLDLDADFAAFLERGVDPMLRRAALRKLWTLDPVFASLDGLDDYAEDFTDVAKASSVVHTAFRVVGDAASADQQTTNTAPHEASRSNTSDADSGPSDESSSTEDDMPSSPDHT